MDHADYAAAVAEVRRALLGYAEQVWVDVSVDDAGLERVVSLMVPQVLAAQLLVADFTAIYLEEVTGATGAALGHSVADGRGVPRSRCTPAR